VIFLDLAIDNLLKEFAPLKIVANLPYSITTPILEKLCDPSSVFSSAIIMVQKELADRMIAAPGTKAISSFTIFLKTYCIPRIVLKVSRHCFYPAPTVDSRILQLDFQQPIHPTPQLFLAFVRRAFLQRRKMLRSTLKIKNEPYSSMRPEMLSMQDWLTLYETETNSSIVNRSVLFTSSFAKRGEEQSRESASICHAHFTNHSTPANGK
jgi:16S rRNA (adenine1518-N6/adenine1519-N6)-dimethyltransferase